MSAPGNAERRPWGRDGVAKTPNTASITENATLGERLAEHRRRFGLCPHGRADRPGVCRRCVGAKRRAWAELNALCGRVPAPVVTVPCGPWRNHYGQDLAGARSEARRLDALGWALWEISERTGLELPQGVAA